MERNTWPIGKVLRRVRESRGLTQAEVAAVLGVSRSTVVQMENGNRAVKAEDLGCLASFYGCSSSELLPFAPEAAKGPAGGKELVELFDTMPELGKNDGANTFQGVLHVARALSEVEEILGFEAIVNVLPVYAAAAPETPWQAARQGYRAAEDERRRMALGEGAIRFVDEYLTTLGVRAAKTLLPQGITSIFLNRPDTGSLVVVNEEVGLGRRRFSYAHGLAHILFDRDVPWRVCRSEVEQDLREMRANAFASGLLLPEHGVRRYLETLGKETLGRTGPAVLSLFAEGEGKIEGGGTVRVDGRAREGRHPINLFDLTRVAHYYGVSPTMTAHRLRNLRLLSDDQLEALESLVLSAKGRRAGKTLALREVPYEADSLRSRLAALAAEARSLDLIDEPKFNDLVETAGVSARDRIRLLSISGA